MATQSESIETKPTISFDQRIETLVLLQHAAESAQGYGDTDLARDIVVLIVKARKELV